MNKVRYKFLSILFLNILGVNTSYGDFSQLKLRYLSYFDITNHFKNLKVSEENCTYRIQENLVLYGYNSPVTGKPVNDKPNFDFINSYLSCVNLVDDNKFLTEFFTDEIWNALGDTTDNYSPDKDKAIGEAIDFMTMKLIGPEIVLVSYGLVKKQKEFRELIIHSAKAMIAKQGKHSVKDLIKSAFILIQLRDEFLSY
jgi:hypothetical protein